jgi:16S rRNA (guanine527-N7)-methyltransferase
VSYPDLIESEFQKFLIDLPAEQIELLAKYCEELSRWNQKINLTSLSGNALVRRLIVEPIWIGKELEIRGSLLDVGSGNGSPAIPLRIACALRMCHLVESRGKRAVFLRQVAAKLSLKNIEIHRCRVESLNGNSLQPDWITLQAVNLTRQVIDAIRVLCKPTTTVVRITSGQPETVLQPFRTINVPMTGSRVLLYKLDLS